MLSDIERKVLRFCRQARSAEEVAVHLGVKTNSAYKPLVVLQRLDLLEKMALHANSKALYVAKDLGGMMIEGHLDELVRSSQGYIRYTGVPAHNPFNL